MVALCLFISGRVTESAIGPTNLIGKVLAGMGVLAFAVTLYRPA